MKLFAFTIEPLSAFGTPLKGDTIFGHFCWQAWHDPELLKEDFGTCLQHYHENPFIVFSSALVGLSESETPFAAPRPELPPHRLFAAGGTRLERVKSAKMNKGRKWLLIDRSLDIVLDEKRLLSDAELARLALLNLKTDEIQPPLKEMKTRTHNTINRWTNTTGTGMFAPYETDTILYRPGTRLVILTGLDESVTAADSVAIALERIGKLGYGRDASTGLGHFVVVAQEQLPWPQWMSAEALYTLGPAVLDQNDYVKVYCKPFVRFGRHGDRLAHSRNPFKNPVIMADEAAVCAGPKFLDNFKGYVGQAVTGVSKAMPEAVTQGYTLCLPISGLGSFS